jgi:hypothetical protein
VTEKNTPALPQAPTADGSKPTIQFLNMHLAQLTSRPFFDMTNREELFAINLKHALKTNEFMATAAVK